jgi:hypothetical protein
MRASSEHRSASFRPSNTAEHVRPVYVMVDRKMVERIAENEEYRLEGGVVVKDLL